MKLDLAHSSIRSPPTNRCRNALLVCPPFAWSKGSDALFLCEHRRCRAFSSLFHLPFVVLHLTLGQGKLAIGDAGNSGESVHGDRDGRQHWPPEQRIRLVILRLLLGHETSTSPEFSADGQGAKQAVRKLSEAVHMKSWKRFVNPRALGPLSTEAPVALKMAGRSTTPLRP